MKGTFYFFHLGKKVTKLLFKYQHAVATRKLVQQMIILTLLSNWKCYLITRPLLFPNKCLKALNKFISKVKCI